MEFQHKPVLFAETIEALDIQPDKDYIDGTAGGGGHSEAIAQRLTTGRLLSIDRDPDAVAAVEKRLAKYPCSTVILGEFSHMISLAERCGMGEIHGILLDIGVSSHQLDVPERGFSYHYEAPLDMRMSQSGVSAYDLVNTMTEEELARVIFQYGEDKHSRRIARGIVTARTEKPIETTTQLAEIIKASVPAKVRREQGHPARKTFQALRIAVNGELEQLSRGLDEAFTLLALGGRLAVITFHSLEDRMVKQRMLEWATGCTCPPEFPVCVCGKEPRATIVYKRGIAPSEAELLENPRSRSARLRVCVKR